MLDRILKLIVVFGAIVLLNACESKSKLKHLEAFNMVSLDGKKISQYDLKGKITIIKVWATWCGPCVAEIPASNELVRTYADDKEIQFFAISDESKLKVSSFLKQHPFHYTQLADAAELKSQFRNGLLHTIPQHLIVDQDLNIVFNETGDTPDLFKRIREKIAELK